jgi:outer membrane protein
VNAVHALSVLAAFLAANAMADANPPNDEQLPGRLQGDVGLLVGAEQNPIRNERTHPALLPFAFFDYGRLYTRLDTFGVKLIPVGYGYLELAGRAKFDGYRTDNNPALQGIESRQNSLPLGVGTFQITPIGGFFLYALHDFNKSRGSLLEATYAAEIKFDGWTAYPEAGVEYYSGNYTRYYYGVTSLESAASGYAAYTPSAATCPFLSVLVEVPVATGWNANFYLRRKWLGAPIANSPQVSVQHAGSGFVALVRHFD